jgi:hypothetical protein
VAAGGAYCRRGAVVIWGFIWNFLLQILVPSAKRLAIGLGVGFITYQGLDVSLAALKTQVFSMLSGLPLAALQILGLMSVDKALNIIFSAIAFRAVLSGFRDGVKHQSTWRNPGHQDIEA